MRFRLRDQAALLLGLVVGAAIPTQAITAEAARMLVTFMGFVAASVLPTATLMVNSLSSNGQSIKSLNELSAETKGTVKALFVILGLTGLSVLALMALSTPAPWSLPQPFNSPAFLNRSGQAVALALICETLNRTRVIPRSFLKCIELKTVIAVDDARQRTLDNAPKPGATASTFKNKAGFGAVRSLDELRSGR